MGVETLGEIVFRGNIVMKGYLKSPGETAKAFKDGWFWSGDLAVQHSDGYIEIRDLRISSSQEGKHLH